MEIKDILVISYTTTLGVGLFWLTLLLLFVKESEGKKHSTYFIAFFIYLIDTTFACLFIDTQKYCSHGDEKCFIAINVAIATADMLFLLFSLLGMRFFEGVLIPLLCTHLFVMGVLGLFFLKGWALVFPICFLLSSFFIALSLKRAREKQCEEKKFLLRVEREPNV